MAIMKSYVGFVASLLVQRDDFRVFRFQTTEDSLNRSKDSPNSFSCVLTSGNIHENEALLIKGYWRKHDAYGWQFWVVDYAPTMPTTAEDIRRYLSAGHIEGVGPELASRLVKRFGDRTMHMMLNDPVALTTVEGIGGGKADIIHAHTRRLAQLQAIHKKLADWAVPAAMASKVVEDHQEDAPEYVAENPWRLMIDYQAPLKVADRVAEHSGCKQMDLRYAAIAEDLLRRCQDHHGSQVAYLKSQVCTIFEAEYQGEDFNKVIKTPVITIVSTGVDDYVVATNNMDILVKLLTANPSRLSGAL